MSLDLKDLKRVKLTEQTQAWLRAKARITGKTQQEIVREVLDDIATREIHEAKVMANMALVDRRGRDDFK